VYLERLAVLLPNELRLPRICFAMSCPLSGLTAATELDTGPVLLPFYVSSLPPAWLAILVTARVMQEDFDATDSVTRRQRLVPFLRQAG
jgi:hypothetical protein